MSRFILAISPTAIKLRGWMRRHPDHACGLPGLALFAFGCAIHHLPLLALGTTLMLAASLLERRELPTDSPEAVAAREAEADRYAYEQLGNLRRKLTDGVRR